MTLLSLGVELVRQWRPTSNYAFSDHARNHAPLLIDLDGTLGIARAADNRIDVSIAIRIRTAAQDGLGAERRVEAVRRSVAPLADSNPFFWLQIVDDRGAPLAHERFLGNGVGTEFPLLVRILVPARVERVVIARSKGRVSASHRPRTRIEVATGVHARVVTRTYGNPSGPQYHLEEFMFDLIPIGAEPPGTGLQGVREMVG